MEIIFLSINLPSSDLFCRLTSMKISPKPCILAFQGFHQKLRTGDNRSDVTSLSPVCYQFVTSCAYLFGAIHRFYLVYFRMLNYTLHHSGLENVICWIFRELGYTVLNPCEVLKIYHLHCGVHITNARRVNDKVSYSPFPTNMLI